MPCIVCGALSGDMHSKECPHQGTEKGLRYSAGKPRYDLIPPLWLKALADVLGEGARKYAERNWEKGMDWGEMVRAAYSHTAKWQAGESYDQELGTHHLAMAAWNLLCLMTYEITAQGNPNAYSIVKPEHMEKTRVTTERS